MEYSYVFESVEEALQLDTLKVVDNYTIKNYALGKGSYANTYLAITANKQFVACKMIIKKNLIDTINNSNNKTLTKDFLTKAIQNEALSWKKLNHKNIAHFKEYAETPNNIYFFLEYCSGGTLESLIKSHTMTQLQAVEIFKQIVDGCSYLDDMNIFHRDLKPDNIMLHNGVVKIVDFGFSKLVETEQLKNDSLQRTYVGTPVYMSPQVLLQQPYNIKCDVWSLGVIFYRMLCHTLPWENYDKLQSLIEAIKKPPSFPPSKKINKLLTQLIEMMLRYSQKQRIEIKQVREYLINMPLQ